MSTSAEAPQAREHIPGMKRPRWFLFYAVLLPAFTLALELTTHACASGIFDPLATWWHVLLAATVPLANLAAHLVLNRGVRIPFRALRVLRGSAWVSGSIYLAAFFFLSLLALVTLPFSLLAIGQGGFWLPLVVLATLGPLFGWLGLLFSGFALRSCGVVGDEKRSPCAGWAWSGASAVFVIFMFAEAPFLLMQRQLAGIIPSLVERGGSSAAESTVQVTPEMVRTLRKWGNEEALRRICYNGGNLTTPLSTGCWLLHGEFTSFFLGSRRGANQIAAATARECYFKVYGRNFNETPLKRSSPPWFEFDGPAGRDQAGDISEGWAWDGERGGDDVGARLRGLSLHSSRLDWHLDAPSRLAYGEWTIEFRNQHANAQEARCQMLLPPGACVSRLTLWVNGEEREAAFGGKAVVKAAYKQVVVVERRDPVMVNMIGPDRVMTQCFPVPPGGLMKIRLGITAPLDGHARGELVMPRFIERNFSVPASATHSVWLQGSHAFQHENGKARSRPDGSHHAWQGTLSDADLHEMRFTFADPPDAPAVVWTEDRFAEPAEKILTRVTKTEKKAGAKALVIVIDASAGLAKRAGEIRETLNKLGGMVANVIASTDEGFEEVKITDINDSLFIGGRDSASALGRAAEIARERGVAETPVVWLHGSQPLNLPRSIGLEQLLERAAEPPRFITLGLRAGPNRLLEKLYQHASVESIGRVSEDDGSLTRILSDLMSASQITAHENQRGNTVPADPGAAKVWDHLARFAAFEEVLAGFKGVKRAEKPLADLAAKYQLVTPVSSAVVLETQQQYDRAGLKPVDPTSSPQLPSGQVPEPSRMILLLIGLFALLARRRRRLSEAMLDRAD